MEREGSEQINMKTTELGKIGEDFAANLLELQGYRILERNFRCRMGKLTSLRRRTGRFPLWRSRQEGRRVLECLQKLWARRNSAGCEGLQSFT